MFDFKRIGFTVAAALALLITPLALQASAQADKADGQSLRLLLRIPLLDEQDRFIGDVTDASDDGMLRVVPAKGAFKPRTPNFRLSEGYYLIHGNDVLYRVEVTEISDDAVLVRGSPRIAARFNSRKTKVNSSNQIELFRPPHASTAQLKAIPDILTIEKGSPPEAVLQPRETQASIDRAAVNLRQIGLGLLKYFDAYKKFPPASLIGPDGKAWHSWRVLILPLIGEETRYNAYRFDESWDGPNNIKLLDPIPLAYTDAAPGHANDHFTRYAAIMGEGLAFSAQGSTFDGKKRSSEKGITTRIRDIRDGASRTLCVGTVSPELRIPWSKPEDISIEGKKVRLGEKRGFATSFSSKQGDLALFAVFDGSVVGIPKSTDPDVLYSMMSIAGKEQIDWTKATVGVAPQFDGPPKEVDFIYVYQENGRIKARRGKDFFPIPQQK